MQTPILIATSVVRGTQHGDSHGGVYLLDFKAETVHQTVDWNSGDIDFQGRGWDRGLRGIEFDGDDIYIAASDELFVYDPDFKRKTSYRNRYLKHAHEIFRYERNLFVTSTGFNSVLAFDLDEKKFTWGITIAGEGENFEGAMFDPSAASGPEFANRHHINNVFCDDTGMYISGRGTNALLRFNGKAVNWFCTLPAGVHNARPYRTGIVFNDTESDMVRYVARDGESAFRVPTYHPDKLTNAKMDDSALARQGFGRGLCVVDERLIAAGSSPSTVTLYDIDAEISGKTVALTMDVRNAVHGLEVWPY